VKWRRDEDYYARPGKGAWSVEGGGAVITQGIHQVDLLRWIAGPVERIRCEWQLGGLHAIESEDNAMALLRYQNGAMGVFQASTSLFPGFPDRLEIHGTLGSVITEGDRLLRWEVRDCPPPPPELFTPSGVGAAKPMDIPVEPFRRQLENVATAIRTGQPPFISGDEGFETLRLVMAMYQSAREGRDVFLC
jgi:predicted dehydrogenase